MNRSTILVLAILAVVSLTWLWHGPMGAGGRLAARIEAQARSTLDYWEMPRVTARLQRGPLSRRLILSGPADDFQRRELVRIMDLVPGVGEVAWDPASLEMEPAR